METSDDKEPTGEIKRALAILIREFCSNRIAKVAKSYDFWEGQLDVCLPDQSHCSCLCYHFDLSSITCGTTSLISYYCVDCMMTNAYLIVNVIDYVLISSTMS